MVEKAHKRSWSPGSGRTSDNTKSWLLQEQCEQGHPRPADYCTDGLLELVVQELVVILRHSVEKIQERVTGYQEVVAKSIPPAAEPRTLPSILKLWLVIETETHPPGRKGFGAADLLHPKCSKTPGGRL